MVLYRPKKKSSPCTHAAQVHSPLCLIIYFSNILRAVGWYQENEPFVTRLCSSFSSCRALAIDLVLNCQKMSHSGRQYNWGRVRMSENILPPIKERDPIIQGVIKHRTVLVLFVRIFFGLCQNVEIRDLFVRQTNWLQLTVAEFFGWLEQTLFSPRCWTAKYLMIYSLVLTPSCCHVSRLC